MNFGDVERHDGDLFARRAEDANVAGKERRAGEGQERPGQGEDLLGRCRGSPDQVQQQSAEWDEEDQVPQLLAKWQPMPAVRLAWCRVHNGQFGQPRKSDLVLQVADAPSASGLSPARR